MNTVRPGNRPRSIVTCLLFLFATLTATGTATAQWLLDGNVMCAAPGPAYSPVIASDGAGGAIVAWKDQRSGTSADIYAQRFDRYGTALWTVDGVVVCTANGNQNAPAIAADGFGGAVIAWDDERNGDADIFVQRINAAGVTQWPLNGVGLSLATNIQFVPRIVADGLGGAIVAWNDLRSGTSWDIYARHVTAAGIREWTGDGLPISVQPSSQLSPTLAPDGAGGVIIAWEDARAGGQYDIYGQRVTIAGAVQWTLNGELLCGASDDQWNVHSVADGSGGVLLAWQDERTEGNTSDIYLGRFNAAGTPLWWPDGIAASAAASMQQNPSIVSDGAGGAIVAWEDFRTSANFDIYAQRINASGVPRWTYDGVPVCVAASSQQAVFAASDGAGGAIIVWMDDRSGTGDDVYARAYTAAGTSAWGLDGMPLCTASLGQQVPVAVADGAGGVLTAWSDQRSGSTLIYAQRADLRYGYWGYPEPLIESAEDNPGDQGGKVILRWTASQRDQFGAPALSHYSIWRSTDFAAVASLSNIVGDVVRVSNPIDIDATFSGVAIWETAAASGPEYWEWIGNQSATYQPSYSMAVSTRQDAVIGDPAIHYFKVVAHEWEYPQARTWESSSVSSASIDNLAPPAPIQLTGDRAGSGNVFLAWKADETVPDFSRYRVYRSGAGGVTPTPPFFLVTSESPSYVDPSAPGGALHYVVTAVDVHGNESAPSNVVGVFDATDVGDTPPLTALAVRQNRPNPFTGSTDLQIGLPAAGDVSVEIYDVAGRRVRTIEVRGAKAGWQAVPFSGQDDGGKPLASGVYFCRVTAGGKTVTNKMVIAR